MALTSLAMPLLRLLPAERAHELTIRALKAGVAPAQAPVDVMVIDKVEKPSEN